MIIVYQFNEKYVPYAGVSLTSLFINNTDVDSITVFILGDGLSEYSKQLFVSLAKKFQRDVYFPDTEKMIMKFSEMGMIPYRGTYSVYLRLFFQEMIGLTEGRVIYLDADTIVAGNLKKLLELNLNEKSIGMVIESIRDDYKTMIGMNPDSYYFNSGVILFDVKRWCKNDYSKKIIDHVKNIRSSYIGDQDFLNLICENDVYCLPLKYNFQPLHSRYSAKEYLKAYGKKGYYSEEEINLSKDNVIIYHCYRWLGEFPWNKGNLHPFNKVFDYYLYQSPWNEYKKQYAKKGIAIHIEKLLYLLFPRNLFLQIFKMAHEKMIKKSEKDAREKRVNINS